MTDFDQVFSNLCARVFIAFCNVIRREEEERIRKEEEEQKRYEEEQLRLLEEARIDRGREGYVRQLRREEKRKKEEEERLEEERKQVIYCLNNE